MDNQIFNIISDMSEVLNIAQLKKLQEVLISRLETGVTKQEEFDNISYLEMFITAKRIEGCSERTIIYYESTIKALLDKVNVPIRKMTTEILREYLSRYQENSNCSKVTIDNIRRNLSSFFSWLEEEDYILKSPIRRIHKIRTKKVVKEIISDENLERLRDNCSRKRDLAIIDLLISTGMRVGELVNLDIGDLDFEERECIVYGSRMDTDPALFVSLNTPFQRLQISGVETRLRELGRQLGIMNIHPHKFRRTMATKAIDKGMPIEQVQKLLGHQQIDTTMHYAMVNQSNVKSSHRKYIA